jgi:BNR/Asp-box repeat
MDDAVGVRAPSTARGVSAAPGDNIGDFIDAIERFRCRSSGDPSVSVDMSCNTRKLRQDFNPDNEVAIAVNPEDPDHLLAGSNDYYYRFNNKTGERIAVVPTGFFTSFDGGETWIDGQVPFASGNGGGDPAPAFDVKHDVALMAGLENEEDFATGITTNGNVVVSRSTDDGRHFNKPVVVMRGRFPDTSKQQVFYDKEWLTVDNNPDSPHYGRAYLTSSRFFGGPIYKESPIFLSYSDDGGRTWSKPREISGSHPSCSYQETGTGTDCDEDQFSIPEVAPDGTLYVHFLNGQNEDEWEVPFDFDNQIMVTRSEDGGETFTRPQPAVQLEDGASDMPWSVIVRQTVWGHQLRWASAGNISVDPEDPEDVTVVFSDRGTPNPNATPECLAEIPGASPDYDPCDAGPGSDTDIYMVRSTDGGKTWSSRQTVDGSPVHQWFPWAEHGPDGTLAIAWDEDNERPPADTFNHVLWVEGEDKEVLRPNTEEDRKAQEMIDISVTHWAGQYVPREDWPRICGPEGYSDPPIKNAEGKDCNVFHGDYTGLAVGSDGSINVTWTGLNRFATSTQLDPYTGKLHDGYAQDAMFARR